MISSNNSYSVITIVDLQLTMRIKLQYQCLFFFLTEQVDKSIDWAVKYYT